MKNAKSIHSLFTLPGFVTASQLSHEGRMQTERATSTSLRILSHAALGTGVESAQSAHRLGDL